MAEIKLTFSKKTGMISDFIVIEVRGNTKAVMKLVEKIREMMRTEDWDE